MKRMLFLVLLLLYPMVVLGSTPSEENLKKVEKLSAAAAVAYDKGDYSKALDLYRQAHALWNNPRLTFAMVKCQEALKNYKEALRLVKRGLTENPKGTTKKRLLSKQQFYQKKLASGTLALLITPAGSTISIDGKVVGKSPLEPMTLSAGKHKLVVSRSGYANIVQGITIEGGKKLSLSFTLQPLTGKLSVTSTPSGATVEIDGKVFGKTPLKSLSLAVGSHVVKIKYSNYQTTSRRVNISPQQSESITVVLSAGGGSAGGGGGPWFTSVPGWVTLGVGVVAAGVGAFFLVQSNQTQTEVQSIIAAPKADSPGQKELNDRWEASSQNQKMGYALVGVGGGAIIISAILFVVRGSSQKASAQANTTKRLASRKGTILYATE